jgi:hypothetical protein
MWYVAESRLCAALVRTHCMLTNSVLGLPCHFFALHHNFTPTLAQSARAGTIARSRGAKVTRESEYMRPLLWQEATLRRLSAVATYRALRRWLPGPTIRPNSREERGQRAKHSNTGLVAYTMSIYTARFEVSAACRVHGQAAVPA